jgi:hypothetical protein
VPQISRLLIVRRTRSRARSRKRTHGSCARPTRPTRTMPSRRSPAPPHGPARPSCG